LVETLSVCFFIELGSRRVHFAGCTAQPTAEWVTQQARQLTWNLPEEPQPMLYLIRDHDAEFTTSFDTVFEAQGIEKIAHTLSGTQSERLCRKMETIGTGGVPGPAADNERRALTSHVEGVHQLRQRRASAPRYRTTRPDTAQ
jgi:hypothetical protein